MTDLKNFIDELDFKAIIKNPLRMFGYTFIYFTLLLVGVGIYYVQNLNNISRKSIIPVVPDTTKVETDLPYISAMNLPPIDVFKVSLPSDDLIKKGENLYKIHCVSCHGENGKGDGTSAELLKVKPRNFHLESGWINGRKISEIYKTLFEGFLTSGMPSYSHLMPEEKFALVHYVRTFIDNPPIDKKEELQELDAKYKLSEGLKTAPQVPVRIAVEKILKESNDLLQKTETILSKLDGIEINSDSPLDMFLKDKKRAIAFLLKINIQKLHEKDFINLVLSNLKDNGFKEEVVNLNSAQWGEFYRYLNNLIQKQKG